MQAQVVLTVSESKRLIAHGIAKNETVRNAMENGIVAVSKGTTNAYVVEELLGKPIDRTGYVTGHHMPSGLSSELRSKVGNRSADMVFRKGAPVENASIPEIIDEMKRGDVFMKGANAINYSAGRAGVLIGNRKGGTVGATLGHVTARRINFIVPVGLEKEVPANLEEAAWYAGDPAETDFVHCAALWTFQADLYTEIEALEELAGVSVMPLAAGGIGGAEGCVRLLVSGDKSGVDKALSMVEEIHGEPPFLAV